MLVRYLIVGLPARSSFPRGIRPRIPEEFEKLDRKNVPAACRVGGVRYYYAMWSANIPSTPDVKINKRQRHWKRQRDGYCCRFELSADGLQTKRIGLWNLYESNFKSKTKNTLGKKSKFFELICTSVPNVTHRTFSNKPSVKTIW